MIVVAFLAQVLRIVVPYLLAASGGVLSERAGIVALTLEGFMLTGAFTATLGSYYAGSPWVGLLAGIAGGVALALLLALATVRYKADQVVAGIALNLLAIGGTRFFLRYAFDSSSNSPRVPGFGGDGGGAVGAAATLAASAQNPLVWIGILTVPVVAWLLYRTPFGLRVRAAGEKPEAARSLGVPVARVRVLAVAGAGALAGLAGTYLALDQHQFTDGMTAGRGFIALAAVIFGRWDPKRVAFACVLFAAAETFQIQLQGAQLIPSQFVEMIPYVLTIVALAGVVGRSAAPAALGKAE
ncbi:ABC transporter permease [Roseisolibacter sp. H3M3-2]|uniref:ABC transporter permease n=1 Tax=Roseisolibacter sp. H3M3-2 TaxID=3031323 RepID=UPI0023DAA0D4|nr:ABC transporter permease [Roseisolibacter sp. H3M3-2]MDF1502818.1 ABC transporter permease [Roseisolibacter sp. H3M3-2]